jgi:chromosome partitioning protein
VGRPASADRVSAAVMPSPAGATFAVALASVKGGVGKTTAAVNLAYLAADDGARVLLWDLDPQGATTFVLCADGHDDTVAAPFIAPARLANASRPARPPVEVWATAHDRLDVVSNALRPGDAPRVVGAAFVRSFAALSSWYDVVVFDCPAGLDAVVSDALAVVDAVLVPLLPSPLGVRTLEQLEQFLARHAGQRPAPPVLPFFSMVDRRRNVHRHVVETLQVERPDTLSAQIVDAAVVERMGVDHVPVVRSAPSSGAAESYRALWQEVCARLVPGLMPGARTTT